MALLRHSPKQRPLLVFSMEKLPLILGLGASGRSVARCLKQCAAYDAKGEALASDPEIQLLQKEGLSLLSSVETLAPFSELIVSPGFPLNHPLLAEKGQLPLVGEAEFALSRLSKRKDKRMVAVTGSNGKTTTVLLTAHVLSSAGFSARAVGNVGKPLSDLLLEPEKEEILVVELSSFQLEALFAQVFEAAAVLNITENHLDRHGSFEEYARIKLSLEKRVLPLGAFYLSEQAAHASRASCGLCFGGENQNEEAAFLLCKHFGVSKETFQKALVTFVRPAHRIERVAEIDGVQYYNDSKATSVAAVIHAVGAFSRPLLLLVGGVHKGGSYAPWRTAFAGKVKALFGFGPAAVLMREELSDLFPFALCASLEEALEKAKQEAVRGDVVLLSPGGSSYDAFASYIHRGEEFVKRVKGYG